MTDPAASGSGAALRSSGGSVAVERVRIMPEIVMRDVVAFLAAAGLIGGMVIAWARWQLSGDFAKYADLTALSDRLKAVERKIDLAPTHADLRVIQDRIGGAEQGIAVGNARIQGVQESLGRVERDLTLLLQHQLREPK